MLDQETKDLILELADELGLDWGAVEFEPDDLLAGYEIELEHGSTDPQTNVTDDDPELTLKIAWAHLNERPDYYQLIKELEAK